MSNRDISRKPKKPQKIASFPPQLSPSKKDKSVKTALDSRKLNEACIKRKAAMPNMEEIISKTSAKITNGEGEIWMSKIDLDYARQDCPKKQLNTAYFKLSAETSPDIIASRKASTDYQIIQRYSRNTSISIAC